MPITPYLDNQAFDPETIKIMGRALSSACQVLGLKHKDDAATRLLARRIIEAAQDGIHDAELLKAAAVMGLRLRLPASDRRAALYFQGHKRLRRGPDVALGHLEVGFGHPTTQATRTA